MSARGRRPLSGEERALWAEVARSIAPLPGRRREVDAAPEPAPRSRPEAVAPAALAKPTATPRRAPPLSPAPIERRMARALARGRTRAEATIDLHGLTQAQAYTRLLGFLRRAQAGGHVLVLVVTGRGREGEEGRGVLRRMVPHWLALPELRALVLGFQEAGTRQGGAGALYVKLRRLRGPA